MTRLILVATALLATWAAASLAAAEERPATGGSIQQGTRTPDANGGVRTPPSEVPSAPSDDPTLQAINGAVRKNDCATAVRLARPLADKGNVVGERVMGFCLGSKGMGIKKDAAEAAKWLAKAADQGDATAQLLLGLAYFSGNGVKKDGAEATKWCRKAADQGEPRAKYMLASAYEAGIGVPKDAAQALDWYRKALAHGYEQAKADIARLESSSGQGGSSAGQSQDATLTAIRDAVAKKDCSPVMSELRELGEAGNSEAQIDLSNCLYYGWGVPKDLEGSALWTRKAAEQGESGAQYSLGWDYARGEGVQRDPFEAEKWLRKSAEKNNASHLTLSAFSILPAMA